MFSSWYVLRTSSTKGVTRTMSKTLITNRIKALRQERSKVLLNTLKKFISLLCSLMRNKPPSILFQIHATIGLFCHRSFLDQLQVMGSKCHRFSSKLGRGWILIYIWIFWWRRSYLGSEKIVDELQFQQEVTNKLQGTIQQDRAPWHTS